jgi:hypothetical protein
MARARSSLYVIFALADPRSREYRYLNLSRLDAFESRHQRKLYRAKRGSERYPWIEELRQKNLTPLPIRIATVPAARAHAVLQAEICEARRRGQRLLMAATREPRRRLPPVRASLVEVITRLAQERGLSLSEVHDRLLEQAVTLPTPLEPSGDERT